jgi:glycosyltransferase involved in cell wall biosynthesis
LIDRDIDYPLSVLLVTYNQERYVDDALRSLFAQRIDGPIQLVVADDGSTDRTRDIIAGYEGTDDRFQFVYLDHGDNKGITKNYERGFAACTGLFVAVLEGDDYWVSPLKLARQLEFLDLHWECDLCAVNYFIYREEQAEFAPRAAVGQGFRHLTARDQIAANLASNFSTCMYRRSALRDLPAGLFDTTSYDWIVNICVARRSLIGFLEEPMSVYRLHNGGVWTQASLVRQLQSQLDLIPAYDALTDRLFTREFAVLARRLRRRLASPHPERDISDTPDRRAAALARVVDHLPGGVVSCARAFVPRPAKRLIVKTFHLDRVI